MALLIIKLIFFFLFVLGDSEHHIFARVDYHSRMKNASFLAYPPVVAAGNNATTIHYINNTQIAKDGDLVLMDAGEFLFFIQKMKRKLFANSMLFTYGYQSIIVIYHISTINTHRTHCSLFNGAELK